MVAGIRPSEHPILEIQDAVKQSNESTFLHISKQPPVHVIQNLRSGGIDPRGEPQSASGCGHGHSGSNSFARDITDSETDEPFFEPYEIIVVTSQTFGRFIHCRDFES